MKKPLSSAAFGARMRRLSECIDSDAAQIYKTFGIQFEQRWYSFITILACNGSSDVTQIAAELKITHVSVSQTRTSLEKAGLIISVPDKKDARRKILRLSEKGMSFVKELKPIWTALEKVGLEINTEANDISKRLDDLEQILNKASIYERVMNIMNK